MAHALGLAARRGRVALGAAIPGSGVATKASDVVESSFIDDLQAMDQAEEMTAEDYRQRWLRPPVGPLDPAVDKLLFQQMDLDHYMGDPIPGMPGASVGKCPSSLPSAQCVPLPRRCPLPSHICGGGWGAGSSGAS